MAVLLAAPLLGACGGGADGSAPERPRAERDVGPRTFVVGRGPASATVLVPRGGDRGRVGVVFLHGWGGIPPRTYGPWLRHLVARGHVVIYPRYQDSVFSPPAEALPNAILGVRTALTRVRPRALVAVGHSAGGALAADLAAVAARAGLPPLRAVLSLYPGRGLAGVAARIPAADLSAIPPGTRVEAFAGADDRTVGTAFARQIARDATRADARYVLVRDRRISGHLGPQRSGPASRAVFWRRLDALIRATTARRP